MQHSIPEKARLLEVLKNGNFTFSMKLDILRANNYLDENRYNDIKHINRLRNKFAHNLYYDLSNFDVSVFSYCEDYPKYVKPKTKKAKIYANMYIIKHVFFYLLKKLMSRYSFIADIEVPQGAELHKS